MSSEGAGMRSEVARRTYEEHARWEDVVQHIVPDAMTQVVAAA